MCVRDTAGVVVVMGALLYGCGARTGAESDARGAPDAAAGEPDSGDLGVGDVDAGPPPPPSPRRLSAGYFQTCLVRPAERLRVWCWGARIGICVTDDCTTFAPRAVPGSESSRQLSAGGRPVCTREDDDTVRCLGGDRWADRGPLEPVGGLANVAHVSTDGSFACAVVHEGRIACWGDNTHGQLGSSEAAGEMRVDRPVWVDGVDDAVYADAGQFHACAVRRSGDVLCWGENAHGQLGDGTEVDRRRPVEVERVADAVAVAAGDWHTCALRRDRRVICWGSGWLGDGYHHEAGRPLLVPDLEDVVQVGVGGLHTCARRADGRVLCWGINESWQAGGEDASEEVRSPRVVEGVAGARDLATGLRHNCVDEGDDRILCWGSNIDSALGRSGRGGPVALPVEW